MNADMGQTQARQRISVAGADSVRLAQANLLGAQLETRADTIEGACETLRTEAKKKEQGHQAAAAERAKLEAHMTTMMQHMEKLELQLETEAQAQQALTARVELARRNTHLLAAQYERVSAVMKSEATVAQVAKMQRDRCTGDVAELRSAFQVLEQSYTEECGQLRQLAAEERSAALAEARKCAERESEIMHQAKQITQALAKEQARGVTLAFSLAVAKEDVAAAHRNIDERSRTNQASIERLSQAIHSASAEEHRLLAQLADFEEIGREYMTLTAQYETGQSALAQYKSQLRTERAEMSALTAKLCDAELAATAATQESAAATQRAAELCQAAERAEQALRLEEQYLREKTEQCDAVDGVITDLRSRKEAKDHGVAEMQAEEEEQRCQLAKQESFLNKVLADYSGINNSVDAAKVALGQKMVELDQLQQTFSDKKTSLANAMAAKASTSANLEAAQRECETVQATQAEQANLLSTAQESLRVSKNDKQLLIERLAALQKQQTETHERNVQLSTTLSRQLSDNATLEQELALLAESRTNGEEMLAQGQAQLADDQASLIQLVQPRATAWEQQEAAQSKMETVQLEIEALAVDSRNCTEGLDAVMKEQQNLDQEMLSKQAALERSHIEASKAEDMMTAIQEAHDLKALHMQQREDDHAKFSSMMACAEAAEKDAAARLAAAGSTPRTTKHTNAERRLDNLLCELVALKGELETSSAQESAAAEKYAQQLASVERQAKEESQRGDTKRRLEADIEREQVASIRLKRQLRVAEARVRKLEKAVVGEDSKAKASSQLKTLIAELETQNASQRQMLAEQKEALAKEMKFLKQLNATRYAEKQALKQEVRNAEEAVNSLLLEGGLTPKSCLKSPKSPNSPTSENKRVTFNSQSEVKMDSQSVQKVPTKRITATLGSEKPKKKRKDPESRSTRESSKSPAKKSISPTSNPFAFAQIVTNGVTNKMED